MTSQSNSRQDSNFRPPADNHAARDPLEMALSEFSEQKRRGLHPTVEQFAERYPQLAAEIRELIPLIDNLERWKTDKEVECLRRNVPKEFSLERLGEFQLVRELGRGGMGVVFQGFHLRSLQPVAIKILPWRFAADMNVWRERLQREASTIAALQHPNIVPIYSFSEDQGYCYYVMQLVEGIGLDQVIGQLKSQQSRRRTSRQFFPTPELKQLGLTHDAWKSFARLAEQVAQALAHAHQKSILHNDIKPSNLLIRSNGQVIVTDFGLGSESINDSLQATDADEHSVGTWMYMPPERWAGRSDASSDVYSLGMTLYELVTQQAPYTWTRKSQLIDAIMNQDPVAPRRVRTEIPQALESIILKAIAKNPEKRYGNATDFANDLQRFVMRQPVQASSTGLIQQATNWWQAWMHRE